jgi:hypothetical protein
VNHFSISTDDIEPGQVWTVKLGSISGRRSDLLETFTVKLQQCY